MKNSNTRTPNRRIDLILIILLLPGLLSALYLAVQRYKAEAKNKAVEITLDYSELQNLSGSSRTPMSDLLTQFKGAGVTGVAVNEETIGELVETGQAKYVVTQAEAWGTVTSFSANPYIADLVYSQLDARLSGGARKPGVAFYDGHAKLPNAASPIIQYGQTLNGVGIGLSPDAVTSIKNAGLDVVARIGNNPLMTTRGIDASIADLKKQGVRRVVFSGEEVLGFRGLIKYAADQMKANDMLYGSIEFGKQKGDVTMSERLKSDFIRVHSIGPAEMAPMSPAEMAERFARAAKERNIRLLYVRLPQMVGDNPVENSVDFVTGIRNEIQKSGYGMGPARIFNDVHRSRSLLILIALSIAAAVMLLIDTLISLPKGLKYGLLALGFVLCAGLTFPEKGKQGLALLAAMVFPTLGTVALIGPYFNSETENKSPIKKTIGLFLGSSVIALCGAIMVVGLLADKMYMVKVEQFMGIKAAHGLPLLFLVLVMAAGLPILGKPLSEVRKDISDNIRRVINHPLFVWHVLAVVAALVIVGFALMRTGNDSGIGVSGFELKFRAILDKFMMVRPRTKEFLIGHPALFLGIAFLLKKKRAIGLPLVALGMLGQVSLVNTFCHIHTPLAMSAMRVTNGLVLGLLVGWVVWLFVGRTEVKAK